MLDSGFQEYQGARADEGTSPGAAFQANFRGKVNLRCGDEGNLQPREYGGLTHWRFDKRFHMCSISQVKELLCVQ